MSTPTQRQTLIPILPVRSISGSTGHLMESWDIDQVKEAKLTNRGGWHGLGWLGRGRCTVQKGKIASDGRCFACGEQFVCVDIDRIETERSAQSVASFAMERDGQNRWSYCSRIGIEEAEEK